MLGGTLNTEFNSDDVNKVVDINIVANKKEPVVEVKEEKPVVAAAVEKTEAVVEAKPSATEVVVEKKEEVVVAEKKDEKGAAVVDPLESFFAELKEKYDVSTREELEQIISAKPKKEETPEERQKREKNYAINLDKYLQENNIMSRDKIVEYETVKKTNEKDLAVESFKKEFVAENPDADDDDIADAVESRYHFNSENAKLKKFGESTLKKDAAAIKGTYESAYNLGKAQFDEDQTKLAQIPQFNQSVDSYAKTLPSTIKAFEKDDLVVNFEITPEIRRQIVDTVLRTPEVFMEFTKNGESTEFKALLQSKTRDAIKILNFESMINVVAESNYSKGLKSGSTVGAKQPFAIVTEKNKQQPASASKEEAKANVVKDNEESLARR